MDRPNPIGDTIGGGALDAELSSFVGRFDMPIRHGMTVGELAQMMNQLWNPSPCQLSIVPCDGWNRRMLWNETERDFIQSSPSMPHFITALHYPGSCLLEGTYLSEGRGTSLPFQIVGTPYIDGDYLAEQLNAQNLAGVRFRPHAFLPTFSKFANETCYGVQLHITDIKQFDPIKAWLATIIEIKSIYPEQFEWLPPHQTDYERGEQWHFDRLIGRKHYRQLIDTGASVHDVMEGWSDYCDEFHNRRQPYLIYPE